MHFDSTFRLSAGTAQLTDSWQRIATTFSYNRTVWPMVVFAQPVYVDGAPAIVRIRNVSTRSFEARVESPGGGPITKSCLWFALPVGDWIFDGQRIEVRKVESQTPDRTGSFVGQALPLTGAWADPVVLGQVQTANGGWSQFWSAGTTPRVPATSAAVTVGRHIGSDPNTVRSAETVGVLIAEAGATEINGVIFEAGKSPTSVPGFGNSYAHTLDSNAQVVVASQSGVVGLDGAWPVVKAGGAAAVAGQSVSFFVDQDTHIDADRSHPAERLHYVALDGTKDGARFLAQAGWGGTVAEAGDVFRRGYEGWFADQIRAPRSTTEDYLDALTAFQVENMGPAAGLTTAQISAARETQPFNVTFSDNASPNATNLSTAWCRNIVFNEDQLRQRVGFCLSQIMVIGANNELIRSGASVGNFYDGLVEHGLGNFRDLIGHVSFHPTMAWFLSSLGNEKPSADGTRQPDENYARELMQLFTIGLWELEPDGTQRLDAAGEPIPTYDNDDITSLARAFTGLWHAGRNFGAYFGFRDNQGPPPRRGVAMFENRHDRDPKTLFHGKPWQVELPGGVDGVADINAALDGIFNHPNVGPFIAKALIQFMVTSNPQPGYVERVAARFDDNGEGVRGDMAAVVNQILLDVQARGFWTSQQTWFGKVQEPMVRLMQMIKGFAAGVPDGEFPGLAENRMYLWRFQGGPMGLFTQWPMFSPTVFNFFQPGNPLGGSSRDQNLLAPEIQLINPVSAATLTNELQTVIDSRVHNIRPHLTPEFALNKLHLESLVSDPDALVDHLDLTLCRGLMSEGSRAVILDKISRVTGDLNKVNAALWIAAVSPEAVVLR